MAVMLVKVMIYGYSLKRSRCLLNTKPSLFILPLCPPLSNDSQIHMPYEAHAVAPTPLVIYLIHLIKLS